MRPTDYFLKCRITGNGFIEGTFYRVFWDVCKEADGVGEEVWVYLRTTASPGRDSIFEAVHQPGGSQWKTWFINHFDLPSDCNSLAEFDEYIINCVLRDKGLRTMEFQKKLPCMLKDLVAELDRLGINPWVHKAELDYTERNIGTDVHLTLKLSISDIYNERKKPDDGSYEDAMKVIE